MGTLNKYLNAAAVEEALDKGVAAYDQAEENKTDISSVKEELSDLDSLFKVGKNKFDKTKLLRDKAYSNTGILGDKTGFSATELIPVDENGYTRVRASQIPYKIVTFDENRDFVEVVSGKYAVDIVNCAYYAYVFNDTLVDYDTLMICYTYETADASVDTWVTLFPDMGYIPFIKKNNPQKLQIVGLEETQNLANQLQSHMDLFFIKVEGKNKFNPEELMVGYGYKSADGSCVANENFNCTPLIELNTDKTYVMSSTTCKICLYDDNKNFIKTRENVNYASIDNAKYAAFMYSASVNLSELMIYCDNDISGNVEYEPFKPRYVINEDELICPTAEELKSQIEVPFTDAIFTDLTDYIETYIDYQKIITLQGVSGTTVWYEYKSIISPKTVINVDIFGKTDTVDDGSFTEGAFLEVRFYDKDNLQIGSKYNMDIVSTSRFGYHRYQAIAPAGTACYGVKVVTRGATKMQLKDVKIDTIPIMPMKQNNDIIYDCHLGVLLYAPKNTMSAFEMAKIMGFKSVIINVKTTKDNVPVVIHDSTIDATSNGTGNVANYTYNELLDYDFGSWFSKYYTGERIPTLDETLRFLSISDMEVIFSIHTNNTNSEFDEIYNLCKKYNLLGHCMFKCYYTYQIEYLYSLFGDGALYDLIITANLTQEQKDWISSFGKLSYVEPNNYNLVTATSVAEIKNLGCEVNGTIVASPITVCKAIECGVKRFTSDLCSDLVACR